MACNGCKDPHLGKTGKKAERKITVCRVCELWSGLFGWVGFKIPQKEKECEYCYLCDAWICDECYDKRMKRGLAALLTILKRKSLN